MRILLPLFCLAFLLYGCGTTVAVNAGPQPIALIGPDKAAVELIVEVADAEDEWTKGLSGRDEALASNAGMLFVFPEAQVRSFWMRDTHFPLDILFFDSLGKVIRIMTMQPCEADPCSTYSSEKLSPLALEVPAGFAESHGIAEGWQLALPSEN
ncbi:MAG: DUF192 domain-containing protein [Candidatus Peregrinibacteria bacterium]|nr:DUF192 domain-containing protein [Candidatus Peregrinibacteria bacterium]MCB9807701.1 DUF192 domain-containing protein [Candidatus Peribacteria bacterium]